MSKAWPEPTGQVCPQRRKTLPPGPEAADLRAALPKFGLLSDHRRCLGRKTLDQLARAVDPNSIRHATRVVTEQ